MLTITSTRNALAVEFAPQGPGGLPMVTTPGGFVGVPGPNGYAPELYQAFPPPPGVPAQPPACPTCPAQGQRPAQAQPH
jgi:hypothetical protein